LTTTRLSFLQAYTYPTDAINLDVQHGDSIKKWEENLDRGIKVPGLLLNITWFVVPALITMTAFAL
jgi:hypothetical protein